jgi:hypothetical protein
MGSGYERHDGGSGDERHKGKWRREACDWHESIDDNKKTIIEHEQVNPILEIVRQPHRPWSRPWFAICGPQTVQAVRSSPKSVPSGRSATFRPDRGNTSHLAYRDPSCRFAF